MTKDPQVAVVGLGRMGTAVADQLREHVGVRTWSRRLGGTPVDAVAGADVVMLCLYDAAACRAVLRACLPDLTAGATVVNTSTVGPAEAAELEEQVVGSGGRYLHAPVLGSTPAVAAGRLTILAGGSPSAEVATVLDLLGHTVSLGGSGEAAALKLVANGVLGESLAALGRALRRGEALGVPRRAALDVLAHTALGPIVEAKRRWLSPAEGSAGDSIGPAQFTAGALDKDLDLLADATGATSEAGDVVRTLLDSGAVAAGDDIARLVAARNDETWLHDARLGISPELVADPGVLRPLHAYVLTHATGDPRHLAEAFLPTAHVEGFRDGAFVSWDLDAYADLFPGLPAADESTRSRRVERLDVRGTVATATLTLRHGPDIFTDVFVLLCDADGRWRIANKAYEGRRTTSHRREPASASMGP